MKRLIYCLLWCFIPFWAKAQNNSTATIDSLNQLLKLPIDDTTRAQTLCDLAYYWSNNDVTKAIVYSTQAFEIIQKKPFNNQTIGIMLQLAMLYQNQNDSPKSIDILHQLLELIPSKHPERATTLVFLGKNYMDIEDYDKALYFFREAGKEPSSLVYKNLHDTIPITFDVREFLNKPLDLARVFEKLNQLDSATYYITLAYKRLPYVAESDTWKSMFYWDILWTYGKIKERLGYDKEALTLYRRALAKAKKTDTGVNIQTVQVSLAQYFHKHHQADSAIFYAKSAFEKVKETPNLQAVQEAGFLLKSIYEKQNSLKKALYYYTIANAAKDTLLNTKKLQKIQQISIQQERRNKELALAYMTQQNRLKQYSLLGGLVLLGSIVLILYRINRQKQTLNIKLAQQKNVIEDLNINLEKKVKERTAELQNALNEVKMAFNKGQSTERKRVSADLHDEIGAALSSIAIFSDMAKIKAQKTAPELVLELDKIGIKSRDIIQTMRDTIWTLNEDSKQSLWERMYLSCLESLQVKNIELDWQLPPDNKLPELPFNTKRNVLLAFKEAMTNILKHSEATVVSVSGFSQNSQFVLKIVDNGKGFDASTLNNDGNGLHNFEKRMNEIGGKALLNSQLGIGTTLILEIDLPT